MIFLSLERGMTGPNGDVSVNRTASLHRFGLVFSRLRIQDRRLSLEDEPVADTARMVPSSCSCTVGSLATVPPGAASPSSAGCRGASGGAPSRPAAARSARVIGGEA